MDVSTFISKLIERTKNNQVTWKQSFSSYITNGERYKVIFNTESDMISILDMEDREILSIKKNEADLASLKTLLNKKEEDVADDFIESLLRDLPD